MTARTIERLTGNVTTTDATQTTLATYTIANGSSVSAEADVIGKDGSGNTVVAKQLAAAKQPSGTASIVGSVVNLVTTITDAALIGASVTIDASGATVRVRVTGKLATTIEWFCDFKIIVH